MQLSSMRALALLPVFLLSYNLTHGQETATSTKAENPDPPKSEAKEPVEKIEVTGSHIKRIDVEGPSPVIVLDSEHLSRSGYNSVADVLRETTVNSFGSLKEVTGTVTASVAAVNLRGLGATRTLVLLNGKRMALDGTEGAVDLNLIPMAAVERIEILKDGASATYGSDALGGVVNIITKKDFSGFEISGQTSVTELKGGEKSEISITGGTSGSWGNVIGVIYYRDNKRIWSRHRDWSTEGFSTFGSSPGTYRADPDGDNATPVAGDEGDWIHDPKCGDVLDESPDTFCKFSYPQFSTELPELKQASAITEVTYNLDESMQVFGRFTGTRKWTEWIYAPVPGIFDIPQATADTLNGGGPLPGLPGGDPVDYRYRLVELGNRVNKINEDSYMTMLGVRGEYFETWEWEFTTGYNRAHRFLNRTEGFTLRADIEQAIADGDFNPFAPNTADISSLLYQPYQEVKSDIFMNEYRTSGEAWDMKHGPVGMAVGVQTTRQVYTDKVDEQTANDKVFSMAGTSGGGGRNTYSTYVEFSLPMNEATEMQVAARYDNYSDFGGTVNPKVGVRYQHSPRLLLRSSLGTGFKAPDMKDLYATKAVGFPFFIDKYECAIQGNNDPNSSKCQSDQHEIIQGGNPDLKEEKTINANVGAIYQATRDLNFGFDAWFIQMDNVIDVDFEGITEAELAGLDLSQYGIIINRDGKDEIIDMVAPLINLAKRQVLGIDVGASYNMGTSIGLFRFHMDHSHLIFFKQEDFPGLGFENKLGENSYPAWRNVISTEYSPVENHEISVAIRTVGEHSKAIEERGKLGTHAELDARYKYEFRWNGTGHVGIKNLLGTTPPLDDTNNNAQLNERIYDQIGRYAYVGYKHRF